MSDPSGHIKTPGTGAHTYNPSAESEGRGGRGKLVARTSISVGNSALKHKVESH